MCVGLPYAMGIKLAKPDSDVFFCIPRSSIQMCIQELSDLHCIHDAVKIVSLTIATSAWAASGRRSTTAGVYSHS